MGDSSDQSYADARETARRVLAIESQAVRDLGDRLDEHFDRAVEVIHDCNGRLVVTGMGKSGQICRKLAATFASTGTSSFFLHAAEAIHGDLGMLARGDVCLAISNSGTTTELIRLLPAMKRLGLPIIAMTGGLQSPLAEDADLVLDVSVKEEACPLGLAPTASTTATLALGDALAVAVLERRGFTQDEFALLHPGGALGQKLLRVADVMHTDAQVPRVDQHVKVKDALDTMTRGGFGIVAVTGDDGRLVGVFTDGDVRRGVLSKADFVDADVADVMASNPKTVGAKAFATEALATMEKHSITALFIVDSQTGAPEGLVHLHDLLKATVA